MNRLFFGTSLAAALVLSGCQGSTTVPQGTVVAQDQRTRGHSASGSSADLLYVADGKRNVLVYIYPQQGSEWVPSQTIKTVAAPSGICPDTNGDVFVINNTPNQLFEFAHGGTKPKNKINLPATAYGCAVDPATGDLAVPMSNELAIYKNAKGTPKIYTDPYSDSLYMCAYDDAGHLFVSAQGQSGNVIVEFSATSGQFIPITLSQSIPNIGGLQWDGTYLAVNSFEGRHGNSGIYQVKISGSQGQVVHETGLKNVPPGLYSWIQGGSVMVSYFKNLILVYSYPEGGRPQDLVRGSSHKEFKGMAVSVPPST